MADGDAAAATGGKKKLSPEEKKELKRLKALEKKLAAEEKTRQLFRDQLQREIKFTKLTYEKSARNWEKLCVDIKIPEVQLEVRSAVQGLQRAFDRKNYFIERLRNDIHTAADQYRNNFIGHLEAVESFIEYYKYFMNRMKEEYEEDCKKLLDHFQVECDDRYACLDKREVFLKTSEYNKNVVVMNFAKIQANYVTNIEFDAKAELQVYKEHLEMSYWKNHMNVIKEMLDMRALMKRTILSKENLDKHMQLNQSLIDGEVMYENQIEADENFTKLIRSLERQVTEHEHDYAKTITDLNHVRLHLKNCFSKLEEKFDSEVRADKQNLTELIIQSEAIIKYLEELYKKGEFVLQGVTICRKYETQEEKVMPWPNVTELHEQASREEINATTDESLREISQMKLFWRRVTKVIAQNIALKEEKAKLQAENENLQKCIKQCWSFNLVQHNLNSLDISMHPTHVIPVQFASHSPQIALATRNRVAAAAKAKANAKR